jgi:Ca-activated chloride channel family protein
MAKGSDYYQVLGVPRDATPDEIRAAYFDAAKLYHPDANPDPILKDKFLIIQQAYEVLNSPEKRASFEAGLPPPFPAPQIVTAVRYSRTSLPYLDEPQLVYVLADLICTSEPDRAHFPPVHVCLVIDRSTSMDGPRLDMIKSNANHLLQRLKAQDMVSIVVFSDRAEILLPPTRVSDLNRLDTLISQIRTGGATEMFQGLELGVKMLCKVAGARIIRQLIMLTDGHTYGDEARCLELGAAVVKENITINCLGIGHEWNDAFLDKLSGLSGGNAVFVSSSKDLYLFLEQKISAIGLTYARSLSYELKVNQDVQLRYAFRVSPELGPLEGNNSIKLGDLQFGKTMSILFEFIVQKVPRSVEVMDLARGRVLFTIPNQSDEMVRLFVNLDRPATFDPEPEVPPMPVVEALSRLTLYRLQERARKEVESGNIVMATKHLQYLATHLLSQGNRELAHTVLVEAEHIQKSRSFSQDGDKRIKYGTRALVLPSGLERGKV